MEGSISKKLLLERKNIERAFYHIDKNRDGFITEDELERAFDFAKKSNQHIKWKVEILQIDSEN